MFTAADNECIVTAGYYINRFAGHFAHPGSDGDERAGGMGADGATLPDE